MNMNHQQERNMFLFSLIAVVILGVSLGYFVELLAVFLLVYIGYQYFRLQRLYQWVKCSSTDNMPFEDGLFGLLSDYINDCKKQRIAQKESFKYQLERFRKLISVFPDGVVILSLTNEIQWFNEQASKLMVLKNDDIGSPINHLVRWPRFIQFLNNVTNDGDVVVEALVVGGQGEAEKIEIRVLPYGDDERLLLVRDVTKVERANQMRKDFIANASHELRTPLTVMKGYVELLLTSSEKESTPLSKIEQQVLKMQTMIEELLTLSRLDDGRVAAANNDVNLLSLCEQIKEEFEFFLNEKEQIILFDIPPTANLKGNRASLLTVLRNLVSNAVNYSDKGGEIRVEWFLNEQGKGVLSVGDTGKGIAARHLARLTERFYRVAENNVMHKTGTGLGLAIVKNELERHEAQLLIDSVVGKGSRFQCVFPVVRVNKN